MGINNLFKIIKKNHPDQIMRFSLNQWRGYSFAIDISIILNKYVKSAGDKLWANTFIIFLCTLKKHGIKAVCVFDGPNPPIEKKKEQETRRANFEKAKSRKQRAVDLHALIKRDYVDSNARFSNDLLPKDLQIQAKNLLGSRMKIPRVIEWCQPFEVIEVLSELIERLEKQVAPITDEQREKAWDIVQMLGLSAFQADGEAEGLCAYMAIHGYVDAVFTEDTDVLAYGTPWMIAFKDYKLSDEQVVCIYLPYLLESFGYTMDEFRDLCILLKCDYNKHSTIMGYLPLKEGSKKKKQKAVKIGSVGAIKMINEYRKLEEVEKHIVDISPLIYPRCRQLFTPITNNEMIELIKVRPYNLIPNFIEINDFIKREKLNENLIQYIANNCKPMNIKFS